MPVPRGQDTTSPDPATRILARRAGDLQAIRGGSGSRARRRGHRDLGRRQDEIGTDQPGSGPRRDLVVGNDVRTSIHRRSRPGEGHPRPRDAGPAGTPPESSVSRRVGMPTAPQAERAGRHAVGVSRRVLRGISSLVGDATDRSLQPACASIDAELAQAIPRREQPGREVANPLGHRVGAIAAGRAAHRDDVSVEYRDADPEELRVVQRRRLAALVPHPRGGYHAAVAIGGLTQDRRPRLPRRVALSIPGIRPNRVRIGSGHAPGGLPSSVGQPDPREEDHASLLRGFLGWADDPAVAADQGIDDVLHGGAHVEAEGQGIPGAVVQAGPGPRRPGRKIGNGSRNARRRRPDLPVVDLGKHARMPDPGVVDR